jgi:proteasome accessory factor A
VLWRRLHVIIGDATMLEVATYLRTGTTSLVLWLIERAAAHGRPLPTIDAVALADPVADVHEVSRDLSVAGGLELADGRRLTALQVQHVYLDAVRDALAADGESDPQTADVVARWADVLDRLAADPSSCARDVEWVAKLRLLEGLRRRENLGWDHAKLAAVDLQWSDVRPERGLYHRLVAAGAVELLVDPKEVARAAVHPPVDTRAYFRGEAMARYGRQISAASWDSVIFDVPGASTLQRVPMRDPLRGTKAHVGELLDRCPDAASLLAALGS